MERPFPAYKGGKPYIFVSYAHEDSEVVFPEIQWLKDQGFNLWYAAKQELLQQELFSEADICVIT